MLLRHFNYLFMIIIHSVSSSSSRCFLPEMESELDLNKLLGTTWYVGLQTNDIMASEVNCVKLNNFTKTMGGLSLISEEHGEGTTVVKYGVHFIRQGPGLYSVDRKQDEDSLLASHKLEFHNDYTKAVNDMDENEILRKNTVISTDYINYFAFIGCLSSGKWNIWT
uniref:uncharacterized protein LOC120332928 isoform X1 n=1 Tax=Styela clava TaxID=7725 RepID=UPI001939A2FF|nr:uncharacterized protein LOC120332928 isoform X1 [Styela clava]